MKSGRASFLQSMSSSTCLHFLTTGGTLALGALVCAREELHVAAGMLALPGSIALLAGTFGTPRALARTATENRALRKELEITARQLELDPLTGHLNRTAFNRILSELANADSANTMVMLIFFDLNRFKEVNDTLGHDIGDQLLQQVAERAAAALPQTLAFARLGGDEYAALVPYVDDAHARQLGHDLAATIGKPFQLGDRMVEVSASVGMAIGDPAVHGGDELLRRADLAMYEVKGSAKGGHHIYDDLMFHKQKRESVIRTELGKSDFSSRFALHYQPIINARTGKIDKAEALLRTNSAALDGISPALMVGVAEDSGQIVQLTDWTLDEALKTIKALGIPIAVNVSPIYFRHQEFADRVIEKLIAFGVSPSKLIIEITEGVLIADMVTTKESIEHLRAIGIKVWLDDFGTGYSSLSYLQNFELDGLKLDRSFINELGRNDKAGRIIRSIIDFGHSLEMKTVVEGVESEWQARMLQLQGCDYLQGFFLGVPTSRAELQNLLAASEKSASIAAEPIAKPA